jgi:RNA polymerase sigma factor (sigma-70 family)
VDRSYADASRGDASAALALLQLYLPRLRAFVRSRLGPELRARESHSDVVQSVCRELIEAKEAFRYEGETAFRGWLFTAALNKVREKVRHHRQERRDVGREEPASGAPAVPADSAASPTYAALASERVAVLEAALDMLSDSDREVIGLARLAGLPIADVAVRLGKNVEAARKQLGRALLRLGDELRRSLPEDRNTGARPISP